MESSPQIESLISPVIEALGYELVRVQLQGSKRLTLQIMVERSDRFPIKVEDCARLSREISAKLDEADPIKVDYVLEVSSPGIDRPLTRPADYGRFLGHEAKIELAATLDGRKRFQGEIAAVADQDVTISIEGQTVVLPFARIKSARLILTDKLIEAVTAADEAMTSQAATTAA